MKPDQHSNLLISVNAALNLALFSPALIEAQPRGALVCSNRDTSQAVPLDDTKTNHSHGDELTSLPGVIRSSPLSQSEDEMGSVRRKWSSPVLQRGSGLGGV